MNKVEKQEKEIKRLKNTNIFLAVIIIGLLILLTSYSVKIENLQEEKEDLCYISNKAIEILNQFSGIYELDVNVDQINCYSGDAERRLEDE